jgi:hypothetical protein
VKKGFLHLIVPPERFQLISGKDDLTTYEFNTKTAKHTFCKYWGAQTAQSHREIRHGNVVAESNPRASIPSLERRGGRFMAKRNSTGLRPSAKFLRK